MDISRLFIDASTEAEWARKRLSDQVANGDIRTILMVGNLHAAIFAEAQVSVFARTLQMQSDGLTPAEIRDHWLREVLNGADDRQAGRENDARRVSHNGVLRAVNKVIRYI